MGYGDGVFYGLNGLGINGWEIFDLMGGAFMDQMGGGSYCKVSCFWDMIV